MNMDDSKIVDLYLARDESAIVQTAEKYGASLRRIAYSILHTEPSAEECENDTYLETWNRIPPNEPRSWLFAFCGRIIRHLAIDECRKLHAQKRSAQYCELTKEMEQCIPSSSDTEGSFHADQLTQMINEYLKTCSEEKRNLFVRRYWYFDSIEEIAGRYGISESKVKTALHRMRKELKTHLSKEGYTI